MFQQYLKLSFSKFYVKKAILFALVLVLISMNLALISYSKHDPSFSTASNFAIRNLLGLKGSIFASFCLQWFGASSYIILGILTISSISLFIYGKKTSLRLIFLLGILGQLFLLFANQKLQWSGIIPYFIYQNIYKPFIPPYVYLLSLGVCITVLSVKIINDLIPIRILLPKQKMKDKVEPIKVLREEQEPTTVKSTQKQKEAAPLPAFTLGKEDEFILPPLDLLEKKFQRSQMMSEAMLQQSAQQLQQVLNEFGIKGTIDKIHTGPVITLYEFIPAPGIKTSRVISLADDIARSMSALSARIAVIPGQNVIGIELPNKRRNVVYLRELLESDDFKNSTGRLNLGLGQDIMGKPITVNLEKMPHLLIAGTTGSGKSVAVNTMILSLLYKLKPSQCRFVMIDPKMLELSVYDNIPHLLAPVVTDPKKAVNVLKWAVREMERRYMAMSKLGVRNIDNYNQRLHDAKVTGEVLMQRIQTGFDQESGKPIYENQPISYKSLPYIVVVVDEMADLMMVAGKEIEICVQRLAQMARAAGIHLIMATQRPSVDVITGTIKANFPTRVSFHVTSKIDSRTILGEQGAEQLLGQGDMLYMAGGSQITRIHGPFVSDKEVGNIVAHLKKQGAPEFDINLELDENISDESDAVESNDPVYTKAVNIIMQEGKVSTSFLQRKLQIGYNRAARIVEEMEEKGLVSAPDHTGKRKILVA